MKTLTKNRFHELLQKQANQCENCTVGDFNNCPENIKKHCRHHRKSSRAEAFLSCFVLLFAAGTAVAQVPEIGYLVTVHDMVSPRIEVYRLDDIAQVDSLVVKTFARSIPWFEAVEMLKETNFFEITSEHKSLYCEKKRIVGRKPNGDLKLRNLKRWRL